jgi:hypothetical protein
VERTIAWIDQNRRMSQRLREVVCERGGVRVRCHDSPHDEAARPCMRAFHTASEDVFSEVRHGKQCPSNSKDQSFGGCASPSQLTILASLAKARRSLPFSCLA